ncbi:phage tail protein [Polaribacter sp. NJDZ03]|uniref:phage tail protein n=1 Tax=Polaribacter sp. NJDZ03 TaxID=2855841 RepID=UPI001C4A2CD6|nr:tail fiber protein [Polaribacter sp. NJDZ03]
MDEYIGIIKIFAGDFAPRGWAFCEGQLLAINSNTALFSILGTTYGGDGRTTFGLPDLRSRVPVGLGNGPGLTPRRLGEKDGTEHNVLNVTQMPPHTHAAVLTSTGSATATIAIPAFDDTGDSPDPSNTAVLAKAENTAGTEMNLYTNSAADTTLKPFTAPITNISGEVTVGLTGAGQNINNMQPFLGLNYIICMQGIFPSRS